MMSTFHLFLKHAAMFGSVLGIALGSAHAEAADLRARYVEVRNLPPDQTFFPGDQIDLRCAVQNDVGWTSPEYSVSFYLSKEKTIGLGAHLLGSVHHSKLHPWQLVYQSESFTLSDDFPNGRYYAAISVLCPGDSDLSNNTAFGTVILVGTPGADLAVRSVDAADGWYRPGDEISVTVGVKNVGQLASGGYSITCYACQDPKDTETGYCLGVGSGDSLNPGQEGEATAVYRFPGDIPDGDYYILAVVACGDDNDPSDNEGYDAIGIRVAPFADLIVQSVEAVPGVYMPEGELVVHTTIANVGELPSGKYLVHYYMSRDTTITPGDYPIGKAHRDGLAPAGQDRYDATCRLPPFVPEGNCYVGAITECPGDGRPGNNCGCDAMPVAIAHAAGYVCGRVTYDDLCGWSHPVRYARVEVFEADDDADPANDLLMAETYTDGDGHYGVLPTSTPNSGAEIYVKVYTDGVSGACPGTTSAICTVKDDVLKRPYGLKSIPQPYALESSTTISLRSPKNHGEFMVYDSIVEGFLKTKELFGAELDPIIAYWPSSDNGTYYVPSEGIFLERYDRGDRDVILHEYGHYVADAHSFALGSVGLDPIHYWNVDLRFQPTYRTNEQGRNLAFREAWATLFSIATQYGDTGYPSAGDAKYQDYDEVTTRALWLDLEADTYGSKSPGEYYENMNCCALWDVFDDHNDLTDNRDTLSDPGLSRIWTICREDEPNDIVDFWDGWFARYDDAGEMVRNFLHHKMAFKCPYPSPTFETFETGDLSGLAWKNEGDLPWVVTADTSWQGTYCAKAGAIGNNQKSTLEIKLTCDGGWMSFWRKVSSEMGCDKLQFFIDGARKAEWSGELDWQQTSYLLKPGEHTFTWMYLKDTSLTEGADTGWLDDIEFPVW